MPNPKMLSFCHLEAPIKSERHVARHIGQKILFFVLKFSKIESTPNFLEFGLSLLHQALCWAKEASTNI